MSSKKLYSSERVDVSVTVEVTSESDDRRYSGILRIEIGNDYIAFKEADGKNRFVLLGNDFEEFKKLLA